MPGRGPGIRPGEEAWGCQSRLGRLHVVVQVQLGHPQVDLPLGPAGHGRRHLLELLGRFGVMVLLEMGHPLYGVRLQGIEARIAALAIGAAGRGGVAGAA